VNGNLILVGGVERYFRHLPVPVPVGHDVPGAQLGALQDGGLRGVAADVPLEYGLTILAYRKCYKTFFLRHKQ